MAIVVVLGAVVGWGLTLLEFQQTTEDFSLSRPVVKKNEKPDQRTESMESDVARAVILGEADHDFGSMERYAVMRHTFKVKNTGTAELTLDPIRTTCKCTLSNINGDSFEPGEIAEVTLEWTGRTLGPEPDFYQTAEIATNDPDQEVLELKIHGYVTESIRALPQELSIGRVSSNIGTTAEFQLFGFRTDQIKVLESAYENKVLAPFFSVAFEPLPPSEIKQEKGASSGLLAKLAIKSGLPLGPIDQTIRIKADVGKIVTIHMPVKGTVVSDIIIASPDTFNSTRSLLSFGAVPQGHTKEARLHMFVRGPYREETDIKVGSIDPPGCFDVTVGPPQKLNEGKAIRRILTVKLRSDAPKLNRLGSSGAKHGRIVLETTHPETKQVYIYVKFAVK